MDKSVKQEMEEALKSFSSKNFMFTKSLSEEKMLKEMEKSNTDGAARDALLSIALGIFKTQTDKAVLEEAVATLPKLQEEYERVKAIEPPKDGYTPKVGKDFFTKEQITAFQEAFKKWATSYLASNRPKDGVDADEEKIIKAVLKAIPPSPAGYTPKKGKDYLTPFEVAELKREVTPAKGVDYFTKRDKKELLAEIKKDVKFEPVNVSLFNRDKNLGDLQNVNLSNPTDNQSLTYDAATGTWVNETVSGGSGTPGGSNTQVQFNDSSAFGGDSAFTWDKTNDQLAIGVATVLAASPINKLVVGGSVNSYFATYIQNKSAGGSASTDVTAGNDIDNGDPVTGHFVDIGVNSSTYNDPAGTFGTANDTYLYGVGGDLVMGTGTSGKNLEFFTGGFLLANRRARITDTGMEIGLTGTLTGQLRFLGSTSGTAILTVGAAAGTPTLTLPTTTGTLALTSQITGTNSGTNTGDQTSIVGITGTMAQFDTAVSDGNIVYQSQALGTPSSGTLTNATGLPIAGLVASTSTAIGVGSVELGHASDTTLSRSAVGVLAVEGIVIPSISSTNTLTNKRVTPRIGTETSSATSTPTADSVDQWNVTALAAADAFAAPTGTPTDGQRLTIRIKDNGTVRALTWNSIYRASSDLALPTTTTLSKTLYLGFIYNGADSKWDMVAKLDNF